MNIFLLHHNAEQSAEMFLRIDPVRARKQLLECCQMIATCDNLSHGRTNMLKADGSPYKKAHPHHPCVTWALKSESQAKLLIDVAVALSALMPTHACTKSLCQILKQGFQWIPFVDRGMIVVRRNKHNHLVRTRHEYADIMLDYLREKWNNQ